jgi:hypothetical protein
VALLVLSSLSGLGVSFFPFCTIAIVSLSGFVFSPFGTGFYTATGCFARYLCLASCALCFFSSGVSIGIR